ncbi:hypothetical protein NDU88_005767 [Pleurodeles waltl]|uniref:Uncharacterized protein n=1 Tax=Pleurodeles waltl TaxID=8319 RepID=A0AAV7PGV7_PLEWA|nr:hypothetical protein NDU88_005767 [Pleurodeles waltl]
MKRRVPGPNAEESRIQCPLKSWRRGGEGDDAALGWSRGPFPDCARGSAAGLFGPPGLPLELPLTEAAGSLGSLDRSCSPPVRCIMLRARPSRVLLHGPRGGWNGVKSTWMLHRAHVR